MKKLFSLFAAVLFAGSMMAGTVKISNAAIVAAGTGASGYSEYTITDDAGNEWTAFAIKNKHSNATADKHYLQIKKYNATTPEAYYIQIPDLGENILSIKMTVSGANQAMTGGNNSSTLFFSASNSTSAAGEGVVSGTGASEVTIDASTLALQSGYITSSGAVRIWEIEVTTGAATAPVLSAPSTIALGKVTYSGDFYEIDTVLAVSAMNLTEDIAVSSESDKLTFSSATIDKDGGNVTISIRAEEGELNETVLLKSGDTEKTIVITASIIKVVTLPGTPATMTAGTNAQAVKVNGVDGVKAGNGDNGGSIKITVPANTAKLHFFAVAWNGEAGDVAIEAPEGVTLSASSITVEADNGIKASSPFTLEDHTPTQCIFELALSGVSEETDIIFSRSGQKQRFVVWGATYELSGEATAISNTAVEAKAVKSLENGMIVIEKDGKKYNVLGVRL